MKKTVTQLADGRELIYFDTGDAETRAAFVDQRPLEPVDTSSETRFDPVQGEWVAVAAHRQGRPYLPPTNSCPLCPSTAEWHSEIPAPDYEVVVFENRFPSLSGVPAEEDTLTGPLPHRAHEGGGRCEVVCFTSDHNATFAKPRRSAGAAGAGGVDRPHRRTVRRCRASGRCTASRTGATRSASRSSHPHGQIYAFPYLPPKTARAVDSAAAHRERTGRNLFDDVLAAERAGSRVVLENEEWTARGRGVDRRSGWRGRHPRPAVGRPIARRTVSRAGTGAARPTPGRRA